MAHIPKGVDWYLAEMIEETHIEGESSNSVDVNWVLFKGNSPEEAYERSLQFGADCHAQWKNPEQKTVTVLFRGLRGLYALPEEPADGAEILFQEYGPLSESRIQELVKAKDELSVFKRTNS